MASAAIMETYSELQARYEDLLRGERYDLGDRITTALDDYVQRSKNSSSKDVDAVGWGCPRVRISMAEIRSQDPALSVRLRNDPLRHLRALEAACHSLASEARPGYDKENVRVKVALAGPIGASASSPRSLTSSSLRQLVCVEGVATKQHQSRDYVDATDPQLGLQAIDASGRELTDRIISITSSVYPTKDAEGNPMETEFGLSTFKDHQTITLQEMPEKAPMGQLPRSVELILDHDLVDRIKPGDRVQVVGVFRALATSSQGQSSSSGTFKTVVLVNNIQILGRDVGQLSFSTQDVRAIRTLAQRSDILEILGRSFAPSIHGHSVIKKALCLQQLSGCEKNLDNGTHLRGDINILMVGDPSTAKSQLLRSSMAVAPLAISTTGKGSSGVGLTAAVTSDPDTRERRLEAGAMVLADRGLVCVDEFDKMGENDRVAIHEAMEQQTVTIAKAGIHASLNARCSVLAAANPVYGQYDRKRRIQENIGLPDSLLSRFDLLFVVLDQLDPETDRMIATHVVRGHRYRSGHGEAGHDSDFDDESEDDGEEKVHQVWQRSHHASKNEYTLSQLHDDPDPHSTDVLQHDFLRKYLHFAKTRCKPILTEEAREAIANRYAEMRSRQDDRTLPITARSLETVIRLASAHAKARLSHVVEAEPDVKIAMDILGYALYHESNHDGLMQVEEVGKSLPEVSDDSDTDGVSPAKRQRMDDGQSSQSASFAVVKSRVWDDIVKLADEGEMVIDNLCKDVQNRELVKAVVDELERENRVVVTDGVVYFTG
ncbi:MCM OB domain [Fragilaria crotonensis]|nr:MCM OB domain [Fragilaria crotonensis]